MAAVKCNTPIFKTIFGRDWDALPPVMHKHYALEAISEGKHIAKGQLTVEVSPMISLLARLTRMLVPHAGTDIPVTVIYHSSPNSNVFHFDRCFHFPIQGDYHFKSKMVPQENDEVIEVMRFGIAWRLRYAFKQGKVQLIHRGYCWQVMGRNIPLPLEWLIGRGHAEEEAIDDGHFKMWIKLRHGIFGKLFGYHGTFEMVDHA